MSQLTIEHVLNELGPSPSSKIKEVLVSSGISEEAARQRISRSGGRVKKLTTIKLPKRESFLYLSEQYGTDKFWNALANSHTQSNSAYGIALQSLMARGGVIPKKFFKIISGSPQRLTKHISSDNILRGLISSKLVKLEIDEHDEECVIVDAGGFLDYSEVSSLGNRILIEDIIISATYDWTRKIGLGSYDAIKKRTKDCVPDFGQFGCDITAPSYIWPLSEFKNNKITPGFIAIDVINSLVDVEGVQYFIKKCALNRSLRNMKPFIGMLIADRFSDTAFRLGKSAGLIFTTPEILFGSETAESIRQLTATLENAAAIAAKNPEKVNSLLNSLSRIEGSAINLRGALFELIVGHLVYKGEGSSIDIGVKVRNRNGERAEIDIRRVKGEHELAIYECKGYQPSTLIDVKDVEIWLSKKVPIIREALRDESRFKDVNMSFEYWTSGQFSEGAISFLKEKSNNAKKYKICWKDGGDILDYARQIRATSMVDVLNQHYVKHPLS